MDRCITDQQLFKSRDNSVAFSDKVAVSLSMTASRIPSVETEVNHTNAGDGTVPDSLTSWLKQDLCVSWWPRWCFTIIPGPSLPLMNFPLSVNHHHGGSLLSEPPLSQTTRLMQSSMWVSQGLHWIGFLNQSSLLVSTRDMQRGPLDKPV